MRGRRRNAAMRKATAFQPLAILVLTLCVSLCTACKADKGPRPEIGPGGYDVVVIGAGGGGLSSAARLALQGMKVLVIEQHDKVGGYMTAFERDDYRFEVSLHAMDGLNEKGLNQRTFTTLGIVDKVKVIKLDPAYTSVFPGITLDVPADPEEYLKVLQDTFPDEAEGMAKLYDTLETINTAMVLLKDMTEGRSAGSVLWEFIKHPSLLVPFFKYWSTSASEMLDDFVQDERLIAFITQLACFAGAEPDRVSGAFFAMMWNSYHFGGFAYFEGGSQAVSNAMAEVIQENGGEILLNTLATKIVMEDGVAAAVRTKDGKEFKCRYVISNANVPDTIDKLVGREHFPEEYVKNIDGMEIGLSSLVVYLGVDHDYSDSFPKGVHSYFMNTSYDQALNFKYYYEGVPEKSTYGLINYTLVDPTNAPEGKNVICLATIMPYDFKGDWLQSLGYDKYVALKEEAARKLIKRSEQFLPGLSSHIEVMEIGTPRTMERYSLNPRGTIFGWNNTPEQSMMKRLPQETPIDNLYLAGAWTFPGGGQSSVLVSGLGTADMILKREKQ
jgi:phytoene desaturase